MIDLTVSVDMEETLGYLTLAEKEQLPFATSKAINQTAKDIQVGERARLHSIFQLRRPEWAERSVKIVHFATKKERWAQIGIHPPGSQGEERVDILGKFESDTEKLPRHQTIAIPVSDRLKRGNSGVISKRDRPSAYNFRQVGNRIVGDRGTFIIKKPDGSGLILQRIGKGPGSTVVALYVLVRRARIRPELTFIPIADRVIDEKWELNTRQALDDALRTAL